MDNKKCGSAFDAEVNDFIFDIETSAKKILKTANKKRLDDAARERVRAARNAAAGPGGGSPVSKTVGGLSSTGGGATATNLSRTALKAAYGRATVSMDVASLTVSVSASNLGDSSSRGAHTMSPGSSTTQGGRKGGTHKMLSSSSGGGMMSTMSPGMSGLLDATAVQQMSPFKTPHPAGGGMAPTQAWGLPPLGGTGTGTGGSFGENQTMRRTGGGMGATTVVGGETAFGHLPSLESVAQGHDSAAAGGHDGTVRTTAAKIDPKLFKSPLFQQTSAKSLRRGRRGGRDDGGAAKHTHSITMQKASSTCNACMSDPAKLTHSELGMVKKRDRGPAGVEVQGPTNWSHTDLMTKYRGEGEREHAWEAWKVAQAAATELEREQGVVVAVARVDRHPMHERFHDYMHTENTRAANRARARNKMKRFVLDVHTVWLTNIEHLREHQIRSEEEMAAAVDSDKGLDHRRDNTGIAAVRSQLQSVAPERAMEGAIYSTHEPPEPSTRAVTPPSQKPAVLPPLPPDPPNLVHLIDGEPITVAGDGNRYKIYISRRHREGEDATLWRITAYDMKDCSMCHVVVPESGVDEAVERWLVRRDGPLPRLTNEEKRWRLESETEEMRLAREAEEERLRKEEEPMMPDSESHLVHQQGVRLGLGDTLQYTLCEVRLRVQRGGHILVVLRLLPSGGVLAGAAQREFVLSVSSWEVLARLDLLDHESLGRNLRSLDLDWWRHEERRELWQELLQKLLFVEDQIDGTPCGAKFAVPDWFKDGDLSKVMARAQQILPLITVTPQEVEVKEERGGAAEHVVVELGIVGLEAGGEGKEVEEELGDGSHWEAEADPPEPIGKPLSLRVCEHRGRLQVVPGTKVIGRNGIWFDYPHDHERTRPVAMFVRDEHLSSTNSVLVTLALALDTPIMAPGLCAWEPYSSAPPPPPFEEPSGVIPQTVAPPTTLMGEPVNSALDTRIAPTCVVLTDAEQLLDYSQDDRWGQPVGHRRHWPDHNKNFFRQTMSISLLFPPAELGGYVFGVTKGGAIPNTTAVNGRNIWHSQQRCVEVLCRRRLAADYAYVNTKRTHQGSNDPNCYTIHLSHEVLKFLARGGLSAYVKEIERIQEEQERLAKEAALAAKIEAGKIALEAKKAEQQRMAAQLKAKEADNRASHLGKSKGGRGVSLKEWRKRLARSDVEEVRSDGENDWERRHDRKTNSMFYHCTDQYLLNPNQWDPPEAWETMEFIPLETAALRPSSRMLSASAGGGDKRGLSRGAQSAQSAAFSELTEMTDGTDPEFMSETERAAEKKKGEMGDIMDQLVGNEDFLKLVANRLGLPANLKPPPKAKRGAADRGDLAHAPYKDTELDSSDDAWSDSEDEAGYDTDEDLDVLGERLPQDHSEVREMRLAAKHAEEDARHPHLQPDASLVPRLALPGHGDEGAEQGLPPEGGEDQKLAGHVGGLGWKRLKKAHIPIGFVSNATKTHTMGPRDTPFHNTLPVANMVGMVDPAEGVEYHMRVAGQELESILVKDILADSQRLMEAAEKRARREERLAAPGSIVSAALQGDAGAADGFTAGDRMTFDEDGASLNAAEARTELEQKAVLYAKTSNIENLEAVLDEEISINTIDENGNTLLMLSVQQGNKRISKFLLRRGANINAQNLVGNTILHYAFEYGFEDLGEYLKSKGADDSLLNAEGLTCYEGLRSDQVADI